MNQITFTNAIESFFRDPASTVMEGLKELNSSDDLSEEITIENLQPVSDRLLDSIVDTNSRVETGSIALADLRNLRAQFYTAKDNLETLEQKEHQDVIDLKNSTKWHERNKFIRIFVDSDVGNRLDEEEAEAREVTSTKNHFLEEVKDLESLINYRILNVGEDSSPEFKTFISQWRLIGQLVRDSEESIRHVKSAYSSLPSVSMSTCGRCGSASSNNTSRSKRHLSAANEQLNSQMNTLRPWYDELTNRVDSTIDDARANLGL